MQCVCMYESVCAVLNKFLWRWEGVVHSPLILAFHHQEGSCFHCVARMLVKILARDQRSRSASAQRKSDSRLIDCARSGLRGKSCASVRSRQQVFNCLGDNRVLGAADTSISSCRKPGIFCSRIRCFGLVFSCQNRKYSGHWGCSIVSSRLEERGCNPTSTAGLET